MYVFKRKEREKIKIKILKWGVILIASSSYYD